ncbi:hypothetical protein L3Q82_026123 [Scortum barcoo]|uniref:Uncharacterized protein n=1 Tax=Scortum barcoo TaxID=214431 RepID=A0ACB8WR44_9TELE|nr:hypothetical protein L3Q82_026123 [Scortum barcoo]
MSLVEEPSQENEQKEAEMEDELSEELHQEDLKDTNMKTKELQMREKRTISPLSLLKEDFNQFKEVFRVFRDTKTEQEDSKTAGSALHLLKGDISQFKEDVSSVFSINTSKNKETTAEKTTNRLSCLKDDLSNVFRIGLSKEKDNKAKEDSSNTFKIKASKDERTDEPFKSLFRRDQKTFKKAEDSQGGERTISEESEEQMDDSFKGNLSEQIDKIIDAEKINNNMKDRMNETEDAELDLTVSETETQQSEEMIPAAQADEQKCDSEEWSEDSDMVSAEDKNINEELEEIKEEKEEEEEKVEDEEEEEKPPEIPSLETLSNCISLFSLRDQNRDAMWHQSGGDSWWVKNYACYLTFDPNTANSELRLSDCNRKATRVWSDLRPSGHLDQFQHCPQVLCREGLLDSMYWEVMWSGGADIGVTYNNISRDGDPTSCLLGHDERSWSLECSEGSYTPCHANKRFKSSSPQPFTRRVGVFLDWSGGSLSFYCISQDSMVHLHTFTSTFTEPLYPGFWVWAYDGSVSLCQVELDWERLLQ